MKPSLKFWNWLLPEWTDFRHDATRLLPLEAEFLRRSGVHVGVFCHMDRHEQESLRAELLSDEPLLSSKIEGELSGAIHDPVVHFEAPPSREVAGEMKRFICWFNRPVEPLAGLARAGVAHLYFECTQLFEDGNGRIDRAIAEMALSQDWWNWARWSARAS